MRLNFLKTAILEPYTRGEQKAVQVVTGKEQPLKTKGEGVRY